MSSFTRASLLLLFLGPALTTSPAGAQQGTAPGGAKALFYGQPGNTVVQPGGATHTPSTPQLAGTYRGVRYWMDVLTPDGRLARVTPRHRFGSGDRLRLNVQSNRDGYVYLLRVGPQGESALVFPTRGAPAEAHAIRAGGVYQVPPASYISLDDMSGEASLLLMVSAVPLGGAAASSAPTTGAKDLRVEVDNSSSQPSSYAVVPEGASRGSEVITVQITLRR